MWAALMNQQDGSWHKGRTEPGHLDRDRRGPGIKRAGGPAEAGEIQFLKDRMSKWIAETSRSAEPDWPLSSGRGQRSLTLSNFPALRPRTKRPEGFLGMRLGMISDVVAGRADGPDEIRPGRGTFADEEKNSLGSVGREEFEEGGGVIAGSVING